MKNKISSDKSEVAKFREKYEKYGYELIDITNLCEFELGTSGWCNSINEPDENIYHIKVNYRYDTVCSFPDPMRNIDDKYTIYTMRDDITGDDFIIFRKVPIDGGK